MFVFHHQPMSIFRNTLPALDLLYALTPRSLRVPTLDSEMPVYINETESGIELTAQVAGLADKDIHVTLEHDILTIAFERKVEAPEGYKVLQHERPSYRWKRSIRLHERVEADSAAASVKNGVLTVTLKKAPENKPKAIEVRSV